MLALIFVHLNAFSFVRTAGQSKHLEPQRKYMPYRSYIRQIKKLCLSKSPSKTQPLALHSIMLALEPRMVFDASLAAGAEALNPEPHAEAPHTAEQTSNEQQETQTERGVDILPFSGEWSQAPQLDFSGGNFTVNEDTQLSIGVNGIRLDDPDSNNFIITISVEHGTLSLDYVAGVVGNQYHFNADRSEVSFEADAQVAQQVLDSLKYQAVKDYNGTDTLRVEVLDGYNTSPESSRFSQTLTINPIADKPEFIDANTLPPAVQAGEDTLTSLVFNHGTTESPVWKPLQLEDADGTTGTYNLVLSVKNGMLSAAGLGSGTLNGETLSYSLNGLSLETINSLLASLQFQSVQDFFGKAELTLSITDTDPALAGNPLVKNFDIDVLAVNDSPNLSPAPQGDRGGQLEVLEVQQDASGNLLGPAEGIFGLEHFNSAYDPFNPSHLPDANGNSALFDVDNNLHQLVVRVDSQPTQGTLWRKIGNDWVKLGAGSTFSLMDVYLGQVKYQHDPALQVRESVVSGSEQDSFAYTVSDGAGGSGSGSVHIALKAVNQLPSVVVKPIPGLVDRLDSTWTADANGSPTENFTIWAYEGEQGIVYAFDVIDPDQAPGADYTLRFTSLPNADYGVFWYSADNGASYQQVTTSTAISLLAVQNGALRFNHSGKESAVGSFNFTIQVTDDGGGEGPLGAKSAEYNLSMNIRPNNDHPEWNSTVNDLWTDNTHTVSVDGTRVITIDSSFLDARDNDSGRENITYTVRYGYSGSGDSGRLLYHTGQTDGGGQPIYRIIASGEKISQTDVDSGKIHWWFNGEGDKSADLQFIVRDGSISAAPVPTDADQPLPFPWPGTSGESSASAWEHGEGPHEGAIGTWQETSPGSGSYVWTPTVHTLTLVATSIPAGTTPHNPLTIDPIPNFSSSQPVALVPEGKPVALTDQMLHAWFTNGVNGSIIDPQESSGNPANLVYRIEGDAQHGHLVISHDGGASYTALGLYGSFTQQDILDGKIYYQHDGTEAFSDTFAFSVSDGRNEAKNTGNNSYRFSLAFNITPVNDTPYTGKGSDVLVAEHAQPNANAATPGGITTITTDHIRIADVDGTGDKNGQGYATTNELYIVITSLPANGTLYLNGQPVSALTNPADLATVIQGGGFATWGSEAAMNGVSVISLADIVAGKLTYQHNGTEQFYDNFSYIVSDNQGISTVQASYHNGSSVNGYEQAVNIVVQPVNDIPEQSHGAPLQLNEGGTATLGPGNITYVDPDGTPAAIQFIVTEIPKYGELTANGKVLGLGSVFTQQDINEGRVKYTQDGSENHTDTFSYKISDSIYLSPNSESFTCTITQVNDAPLVQAPDTVYVESIAGGIIINGIKITDPDYGPNNKYDGAQDTGVVNDVMTVDLRLSDPNISAIDLAKIDLFFWNGSTFADFSTQRSGNTYTLTGTFSQIQLWLSQVKIQSKTNNGTTYDPNGDIHLDLTVHDGAYNNATNTWVNANGSGGSDVYSASDTVKIYISPINNPPTIEHSPTSLSVAEDGPLLSISNGGQGIVIGDVDAFYRGGNSITLSVDHGILLVDPINGPIITGRGTASLSIEGTRDQINQVLASLKYKADANYNGADSLCYIFKDNANSGEIPAGFNTTAYANHGDQFSYDTGRIDTLNNPIWGLAVYGVVNINVTPVNDAPLIKAPQEIFISSPLLFGGNDGMGNPAHILLADIDITGPGSFVQDSLTLTLSVDNGWLILNNADLVGGVSITGGASLTQTLVLQGSLADLNATLAKLGYSQSNWNASAPTVLNITVLDVANGNQSNGSPDAGSALNATHSMLINCSNLNDAPAISLPVNNWTVNEDDTAAKLFAEGGSITLADPDTFSGQIFVTVSVENGSLSVTRAELAAAGFVLSGNPAAQDAFHITADGKTITFKATLSAINNALKQISYKPTLNYNGEDSVRVYVNDCGLWGDTTGAEEALPSNPLGMTANGLAKTQTGVISIQAINDAPTSSGSSANFWGGNGSNLGDLEDSAASETSAKTVGSLFGSLFGDTADSQRNQGNLTGSEANDFAGVVLVGNAASAAQGTWQCSTNNGVNWQDIPACSNSNGLYLAADAQLRFVPNAHFNGAPGSLTVRLVDNSASDVAHNNPALPTSGTQVNVSGQNSGHSTRYSSGTVTLATYIRPVNDAPIASGSTSLASVAEDTVTPSGNTVNALFGLRMDDTLDAVLGGSLANSLGGVVLEGNSATAAQGTWQYSTDNGTSWSTVPANLGDANGLFLAANAKIRFVPANDFNGTPGSLSARLADNSATDVAHNNPALPASGTLVDVSGTKNGGSTRYSTGLVALGTNISAVNDAPTLPSGADGQVSLAAVDEDTANPAGNTVSNLFVSSFEDVKDTISGGSSANNFAGVLITANGATAAQGAWQYHDGTSWQAIPTSFGANQGFAVQANWSLRFVPAANFNGTPGTLSVRLIDDSTTVSGSNPAASFGTMALVSAVGGATRYSTQVLNLSTNINAVNDAPTVLAGKEQSILNHTEDTISLRTVEDLFGQCFSDLGDAANGGSPNAFAGIVITGNTSSAAQGLWQYHDGTNWVNFSATSTNNGLYLSKGTQMRFVPAADYNGTPGTLTLRLVENGQTHYTSGQILDVSGANSGAETQISLGQVTLSGLVAAVNDAPVANNSTAVTLSAVDEDGTAPGQRVDTLFGSRFSDAKDNQSSSTPHTLAGIIIAEVVQNPTKGLWQYSADGGASWTELSANMFVQAGHLIRFEPAADFNGTPGGLSAHLVENSGLYAGSLPASGSLADLTQNGGSSAISSAAVSLQTTINAVNDAPKWNPDVFSPLEAQGGGSFIYIGSMYLDRSDALSPSNWSTANTIAQHFGTAFTDYTDSVAGGSLANSLHGVWVTGLSGTPQIGEWQYSADGGANWQAISAVSETNALFLQSTALVRFAANPGLSLPMGVLPHVGLEAALADSSDTSPTTGTRADVSGTGRGGTNAVAEHSVPLWLTVIQPNYLPEIHNLPSPNTSATEGQPVVLAPGIQISDMDLDHPSNAMHWNGASVSLARSGGAQRDDVFTAGPGLAPLTEGSALEVSGTVIGTVTRNSAGQLSLSFNSQATNALVNSALQSIYYTNTSHNPPASVALQWSVDDGNYPVNGRLPQGDNPPGENSGKAYAIQQVNITPVNNAPFALDDSANTSRESTQTLHGTVLANDWDYEGPVSVSSSEANLAVYGSLVIHADGNYTYVLHTGHPLLVGLKPGESLVESVKYTIVDAQGLSATATLRITITKPAPLPVFTDSGKPDSKDSLPAFTLKPSEPYGTPHTNNLMADKPVVREATLLQEALETSTNNSLWFLNQSLLKMQGSLERAGIILSGRMADQVVYSGFNQKVSLPENLFRHSLAGEHLIYSVSLEDGSPLPAWLYWNSRSLSLHASPDYAAKEPLSVKITATDRFNNKAVSVFRIHVNGAAGAVPVPTEVRTDMRQASPIGHAPAARGTHTGGKAMESKAHEPVHPERGIEQSDQELMPPNPALDVPAIENKGQPVSLAPGTLDITGQIALHGQQGLLHKAQESLRSLMGHGA